MSGRRIGLSLRSAHAVDDPRVGARWMVERVRVAREAGLSSLFVGDHHVTGSPYYQNTPILGRLLAEWGERPAGALFLLPLWHPVLLAEQVGTLAAIADGPFVIQAALGAGRGQFGAMGVEQNDRVRLFERNLGIVRALLAGGEPAIAPVPNEPVAVWIGGTALPAVDRAARLGDGWIASPHLVEDECRVLLARYRERAAPGAVAAIRRDIHVGADDADARRMAGPVVDGGYRGFPADALVVGGPEQVAERFGSLFEMGYDEVLVRHLADDQSEVLASFERLARVTEICAEGAA
jgi:alkanesulfonate monooxygenase SsuD/methylene tetrahydromethanopterin reductase-like flavin-dependent oxidoreductase (luciferase family)